MDLTIFYSCDECELEKISLEVKAREQEDVKTWLDATVRMVAQDHLRRSPLCRAKKLKSIMIPVTGTNVIGGPTVQ